MRSLWTLIFIAFMGCELMEQENFLDGFQCERNEDCDASQRCLPSAIEAMVYWCRSAASLGINDPPALCDQGQGWLCPPGSVCGVGPIRSPPSGQDVFMRHLECVPQ